MKIDLTLKKQYCNVGGTAESSLMMSRADSARLTLIFHAIHAIEKFPFQLRDMRKRDIIIKPLAADQLQTTD